MIYKLFILSGLLVPTLALAQSPARPLVYNETIVPFQDWIVKSANEASILNLFPGFKEPTVEILDNGERKLKQLKMMMYVTRTKVVANSAAVNINLANLISEQYLKKLDPQAAHKKISAREAMPAVVGHGAISNFQWCNKNPKKPDIFLPSLERSQTHMIRPGRPWCMADSRTVCYETCRIAPPVSAINMALIAHNEFKSPGKDFGMATQSEARYYASEAEFGAKFKLDSLTGIKTPVSGILEINFFYINQILLYGKFIVVLQANPSNSQQTILTGLTAFGVRNDAWNHARYGSQVQKLLKGGSAMNIPTGILAGLPVFSKNAMTGFAEMIEGK